MTRAPTTTFLFVLAAAGAACHSPGPQLTLENPEREQVFLDGRRILTGSETRSEDAAPESPDSTAELPFRYYGATRWDVLPNVLLDNGVPVFDEAPRSVEIEVEPPASPWLFPFDFPLEVLDRALNGRRDTKVTVTARPKRMIDGEIPPDELGKLSARARAARSER